MRDMMKEAAWLGMGVLFVLLCLPPLALLALIALLSGHTERVWVQ